MAAVEGFEFLSNLYNVNNLIVAEGQSDYSSGTLFKMHGVKYVQLDFPTEHREDIFSHSESEGKEE